MDKYKKIIFIFLFLEINMATSKTSNLTDIFTISNDTDITIPVQIDSDTMIVEKERDTNKNSQSDMESIVNAERGRDEFILSKQTNNTEQLEMTKDDLATLEKQLNVTSPLLEKMIGAETGREERLTNIAYTEGKLSNDNPKSQSLVAENKVNDTKNIEIVELEAVNIDHVENKSALVTNITEHYVDNDAGPDTRLTDMQTTMTTVLITMAMLGLTITIILCVKCLCDRIVRNRNKEECSSNSDSSQVQPERVEQLKCIPELAEGEDRTNEDQLPTNGSLTIMTLKNNHLIVETEERNDITRNGRETKMKYSPSNDGIFVVEVQQSSAYKPILQNTPSQESQVATNLAMIHRVAEEYDVKSLNGDQESDMSLQDKKELALSNTGLSTSDLSISSGGSYNISYSYTSQTGYEQGPFGYPVYAGYDVPKEIVHEHSTEPLISKSPVNPNKPVVTAAIFKQDSIVGDDVVGAGGPYCIEGSTDGPLLSDVQAREISLKQIKKDKEGNGILVKASRSFNRTDSLPVELDEVVIEKNVMDTIIEEDSINMNVLKGKRASLPIIRTEMYDAVKDIFKANSPIFEKLDNEISPVDFEPPMIMITEEADEIDSDVNRS